MPIYQTGNQIHIGCDEDKGKSQQKYDTQTFLPLSDQLELRGLLNLNYAVCHILDPDQDAEMKTHMKVSISMKYTWFMQYMSNSVVAAITQGPSEI